MKRTLKISALVIGMMALALTGCKKDKLVEQNATTQAITSGDEDITALVIQAEEDDNNIEATYNESTEDISMENEGIAYDYLVEASDIDADESSQDAAVAKRKKIRQKSFIYCLRKTNPSKDQVRKLKYAIGEYAKCKESAIKRARAIYAKLHAKYKKLAHEQIRLYKAGKITKKELHQRLLRIRHAFKKELRELKLKEKLHTALKNCYKGLLKDIKGVLTERQWKAFVECYRRR